jgi:hypothetical protein
MFRRDAYEQAGGYRAQFYFGQDADLWLRMATAGQIGYAQELLYHYTVSPDTISGRRGGEQRRFGELGQAAHAARMRAESEDAALAEATLLTEGLRTRPTSGKAADRAAMNYRIGVSLSRSRNAAAGKYFCEALRLNPLHWRALVRWALLAFK